MRPAPHVPSQAQLRPARSALRFSQARLGQTRGRSAHSLLAPSRTEPRPMPFVRKGIAALTERLDVRVAPAEKEQLRRIAADAGISVAELIRTRALDRPIVSRTDA